ncbi:MAG: hypothetical protein OCU12_00845 [Methanophagales archaeon]|nr:hypothetical protein [Methanophagales archaeon]
MSAVTIEEAHDALEAVGKRRVSESREREEIEALVDSVEILSDPKTTEALRKSDQDIKAGRVKAVSSVEELLAEL